MENADVLVLGAGAAGMMAAVEAARRGRRVIVIDHARAPGEKIRISGGGRCNFTNLDGARAERYLSANPRFALSALRRFGPEAILERINGAGIAWHEKTLGQLFCDGSARQVVDLFVRDMAAAGAELRLGVSLTDLRPDAAGAGGFVAETSTGAIRAAHVVVATGGKSIPRMGASDIGYRLARNFGLPVTETRPALVPLTFGAEFTEGMAGIAVPAARVMCGRTAFDEAVLFTHRGLSGPAVLQISSYWREGQGIALDLVPGAEAAGVLRAERTEAPKQAVRTVLSRLMPERLARRIEEVADCADRPIGALSNARIEALAGLVHRWEVMPTGSEGYRTAEVTLGGVATEALDARTLMAKAVPGLFFVGEVVDVTGWLGGYNFQWAWASGWAAGQVA
ncbi:MAG: NAD(P)/FAD-dependent oxidoreductase [Paracoccaceae bacterium]|nr:NAD(P)/FAD-dependent oxidoreductase [Paracoccaceae bacterium]